MKKTAPTNGKPKSSRQLASRRANGAKQAEVERRAEYVRRLLCIGYRPQEIANAVVREYGVSERTAYNYLDRARAGLRLLVDGDTGEMLAQCVGILMAVVSDEDSSGAERIAAVREIKSMLGLQKPVMLNVGTGPDQGPFNAVNILAFLEKGETTPVIGPAALDAAISRGEQVRARPVP